MMADALEIPISGKLQAAIRPPGSKSITNRALVCAALADGISHIRGALDSEDTQVMVESLSRLGLEVQREPSRTIRVRGCSGKLPSTKAELFVANSGTTIRFLTAILAACQGQFRLDGVARMRERPMADLLNALRQLGADLQADDGCPPVVIGGDGLAGGRTTIRGDVSSQFLSGLLMAAPLAASDVEIAIVGELVSRPYVDLTVAVMRDFGVQVTGSETVFTVARGQAYRCCEYEVEPDASAASYFWAAAAIAGGTVTVEGLGRNAMQGDVAFCECLAQMGCEVTYRKDAIEVSRRDLHGIDVDMNAISDTAQTLAAVALFADGPTRIRGVAHIRHKETDRIGDLSRELRKLGAAVDEHEDGLLIRPGPLRGAEIDTYDDHRMAMSLALVGLRVPGVIIRDPGCTAKTYPHFFDDLTRVMAGK